MPGGGVWAAAPVVASVRIASATTGASGAVVVSVGGSTVTVAPRAAKAWRVEGGKAVVFAVPPGAAPGTAPGATDSDTDTWSIQRWDVSSRKTTVLASGVAGPLVGFTETTSETGRPIFVIVVSAPVSPSPSSGSQTGARTSPQTIVLHPILGQIYSRTDAKPNLIRYGMVRLDTFDTNAPVSSSRATGRETQDFDLLVENAKRILPFAGRFVTASEGQAPDGVTVRIRHTLEISTTGEASLTSVVESGANSLPGPPPANGADTQPYPLRLTRAFGRIAPFFATHGGTVRHEGVFRSLPPAKDTARDTTPAVPSGVVRLSRIAPGRDRENPELDSGISLSVHDGNIVIDSWDNVVYGTTPPAFVPESSAGTSAANPAHSSTPDNPSAAAAAPYIGIWKRTFTNAKGSWEETLELSRDLSAKLTTLPAAGAPASATATILTGNWSIGRENSFRLRFAAKNGVTLSAPDRLTLALDPADGALVGVTFDRDAHGSTLRFTRLSK